jgi:hypothetical protein
MMPCGHSYEIFGQGLAISKWLIHSTKASALGSGPHIGIRNAPPDQVDPIRGTHCAMMACGHSCEKFGQGLAISKWLIPFTKASALGSGPQIKDQTCSTTLI